MGDTEVAAVRDAANQLNLTQRRVLVLHYAEDLTIVEIALVLDLTEQRVETIVAQLREMAQQNLNAEHSGTRVPPERANEGIHTTRPSMAHHA